MEPITPLTASTTVGSATTGSGGRSRHAPQQGPSQPLQATVLSVGEDDRFLLGIGGKEIQARGEGLRLTPGQQLQLELLSTSPTLELKIVAAPVSSFLGRSLTLLGTTFDLAPLVAGLRQSLAPPHAALSLTSRETLDSLATLQHRFLASEEGGEIIQRLIQRLGLDLEQALAQGRIDDAQHSLKAALLEVAHLFHKAETIAEQAAHLLAAIEIHQLAQLHLTQERLIIFPLPLPFLEQGYLLIKEDAEEKNEASPSASGSFSLHLAIEPLGSVRVTLLPTGTALQVRMELEGQPKVDFVRQYSQELIEGLSRAPDLPVNLTFTATASDPTSTLIARLLPAGKTILDTKA